MPETHLESNLQKRMKSKSRGIKRTRWPVIREDDRTACALDNTVPSVAHLQQSFDHSLEGEIGNSRVKAERKD